MITTTLVNCFSERCVSGEKPPEQRGVRQREGGKESGRAAAPPRPRRARRAGGAAGGSKQCQNAPHSTV